MEKNGYFLSIEKDGFNSSGLFTIYWVDGLFELEDWILGYKKEIKNQPIYSTAGVNFGIVTNGSFNGIEAKELHFTTSILGLKHSGVLYAFHEGNRTFSVFKQQANEDNAKNATGFATIENSFICESDSF